MRSTKHSVTSVRYIPVFFFTRLIQLFFICPWCTSTPYAHCSFHMPYTLIWLCTVTGHCKMASTCREKCLSLLYREKSFLMEHLVFHLLVFIFLKVEVLYQSNCFIFPTQCNNRSQVLTNRWGQVHNWTNILYILHILKYWKIGLW